MLPFHLAILEAQPCTEGARRAFWSAAFYCCHAVLVALAVLFQLSAEHAAALDCPRSVFVFRGCGCFRLGSLKVGAFYGAGAVPILAALA